MLPAFGLHLGLQTQYEEMEKLAAVSREEREKLARRIQTEPDRDFTKEFKAIGLKPEESAKLVASVLLDRILALEERLDNLDKRSQLDATKLAPRVFNLTQAVAAESCVHGEGTLQAATKAGAALVPPANAGVSERTNDGQAVARSAFGRVWGWTEGVAALVWPQSGSETTLQVHEPPILNSQTSPEPQAELRTPSASVKTGGQDSTSQTAGGSDQAGWAAWGPKVLHYLWPRR